MLKQSFEKKSRRIFLPGKCFAANSHYLLVYTQQYSTSTEILLQMMLLRSIPARKPPEKRTLILCAGTPAKLRQGHTSPACTLTHICMLQSSNIVGPIPTHQRYIAQALQCSDHKLLQEELCSEAWQLGLSYMSWSSASVLQELAVITPRLQKVHPQASFYACRARMGLRDFRYTF